MIRLAIVARDAYPAIRPEAGHAVGGRETFIWGIARGLSSLGANKVLLIIKDTSAPPREVVDGVQIVNASDRLDRLREKAARFIHKSSRFPGVKIQQWGLPLCWQFPVLIAWKIRDKISSWSLWLADQFRRHRIRVVMVRGINQDSAAVVQAAKKTGALVIVWLGSNADVDHRYFEKSDFRDPYWVSSRDVRTTLEGADLILCQTGWQEARLKSISSVQHIRRAIIPNPVDFHRFHPGTASFETRQHVLWVGRYDEFHKRPLLGMEIASKCPEIPFLFVINKGREGGEERVRAACPKNVTIVEYIPNSQMPEAYRNARLFLSTGSHEYEGFPNVLLEAAASGTPVCSLEDFDQFLEKSGAGVCGNGQSDQLAKSINDIWHDHARWQQYSSAGVTYVREHHSMDAVITKFQHEVDNLVTR